MPNMPKHSIKVAAFGSTTGFKLGPDSRKKSKIREKRQPAREKL